MCEYCTKDNTKPIEIRRKFGYGFNVEIDIFSDGCAQIDIDCSTFDGGDRTSFDINFCPMCGRNLKEN